MRTIKDNTYKGTRILLGNEKRSLINSMVDILIKEGFEEISIPVLQPKQVFKDKIGKENNNLMFSFLDRGNREVALAPEYTAVVQALSNTTFKHEKNLKLFYVQECFRGEKPQKGRYRQFTQLGVEIINPTEEYNLQQLAMELLGNKNDKYTLNNNVSRGLDYYSEGKGFEIVCDELGSSKQVCGGGSYEGGVGFAIGIDRVILV